MKFLVKVLVSLFLSIAVGLVLGQEGARFADIWIAPVGKIFLNLLQMMIIPMVFCSLVVGVSSLDNVAKLGRIGCKTVGLYMLTTFLAMGIGIVLGYVFEPGVGLNIPSVSQQVAVNTKELPSLGSVLIDIFPSNPIKAMFDANMMQIIIFSLTVGIGVVLVGEKVALVKHFFEQAAEVSFKAVGGIVKLTPIGVFGLVVPVVAQNGTAIFMSLFKLIVLFYVAVVLHVLVVYGGFLTIFRINVFKYLKNVLPAAVMAFSVRSSGVTLPVTLKCCRGMNISEVVSSFVLPLGATINMDGTAIYEGMCTLFVAQVYGVDLSFGQYLLLIFSGTLASIGTATVPSASFIMLTMVLTAVGLPLEGTALIAGIDCIIDMPRTMTNTVGDTVVCGVVAKSEGETLKI